MMTTTTLTKPVAAALKKITPVFNARSKYGNLHRYAVHNNTAYATDSHKAIAISVIAPDHIYNYVTKSQEIIEGTRYPLDSLSKMFRDFSEQTTIKLTLYDLRRSVDLAHSLEIVSKRDNISFRLMPSASNLKVYADNHNSSAPITYKDTITDTMFRGDPNNVIAPYVRVTHLLDLCIAFKHLRSNTLTISFTNSSLRPIRITDEKGNQALLTTNRKEAF